MKTLVNCTPREFLAQTVKIKRAVKKWLKDTDIMAIRSRMPVLNPQMSDEEKKAALRAQSFENMSAMFDAIAEKHPDETVELMALLCFIEPEHANDYQMGDYLLPLSEMMGSDAVISFFISLTKLGSSNISSLSKE